MNFIIVILTFISGLGLSVQAAANGALGKSIGALEGAVVSFIIGTLGLLVFMIFFGKGSITAAFSVPKWQLLGGVLGAVYIFILIIGLPRIGVGLSLATVVCAQMVMGLLIDHYGWFQSKQVPVTGQRFLGVVILIVALILIYRGSVPAGKAEQGQGMSVQTDITTGK